ncbi:MAG: hypothetical protein ACPG21_01440 [Crocinitomicaceae bacterium]
MKNYLVLFCLLLGVGSFAQKLKVLKVNDDYFHHEKVEGFHCLHDDMPDYGYTWIATFKIEVDTVKHLTIEDVYAQAQDRANSLGANAFSISTNDILTYGDAKHIAIDVYHLRKENRDENRSLFYRNTLYLFGFLGHHLNMDGYSIKLNGEKMMLEELSYYTYDLQKGDVIELEIGSGAKKKQVTLKVEGKDFPKYMSFHMYTGMFKDHDIIDYDWAFGEFLLDILEEKATDDRSLSHH